MASPPTAASSADPSGHRFAPGTPRLALVAGEASGDLLAGLLLQGLRQRWPALAAAGIGGPAMAAQGLAAWWPHERLAVRGYVEVLRHYPALLRIRSQLRRLLLAERPDLFIGVDAPDFNLGLARDLRAAGIRAVQWVCPSIWAWRPQRVELIRRACDHVLCLFPFEPALLARHGVAASFVGHPLAGVIPREPDRAAARAALGLPGDALVLAVLPGSRRSEIAHHARRFVEAASTLRRSHPALRAVLPAVPGLRPVIDAAARAAGAGDWLTIVDGQSHAVLAACDLALVASGTATLEAALAGRPMVIAYHMNRLSWHLMRRQQLQPWVGLPNILAGDFVVPELLQDEATPQRLAAALGRYLDDPGHARAVAARLSALHDELHRDTARLACDAIERFLGR